MTELYYQSSLIMCAFLGSSAICSQACVGRSKHSKSKAQERYRGPCNLLIHRTINHIACRRLPDPVDIPSPCLPISMQRITHVEVLWS